MILNMLFKEIQKIKEKIGVAIKKLSGLDAAIDQSALDGHIDAKQQAVMYPMGKAVHVFFSHDSAAS